MLRPIMFSKFCRVTFYNITSYMAKRSLKESRVNQMMQTLSIRAMK